MILPPLNDRQCLDQLTALATEALARPDLRTYAGRFSSTAKLAHSIRGLPQRNDAGDEAEGPRIQCDVSQRARLLPKDPNCVERALLYLVTAEHIDSRPERQLATIDTPNGLHTLCVENGEPVVLDPTQRRNALGAALFKQLRAEGARRNAVQEPDVTVLEPDDRELLTWVTRIAEEPAYEEGGVRAKRRVARARSTLGYLALGAPVEELRKAKRAQDDLAFTIDHAARAAKLWGGMGLAGVAIVKTALSTLGLLPRRNCPPGDEEMPTSFFDLEAWADEREAKAAPGGAREE